jgi:hypothetical protein
VIFVIASHAAWQVVRRLQDYIASINVTSDWSTFELALSNRPLVGQSSVTKSIFKVSHEAALILIISFVYQNFIELASYGFFPPALGDGYLPGTLFFRPLKLVKP